jgi:hypothetical protein
MASALNGHQAMETAQIHLQRIWLDQRLKSLEMFVAGAMSARGEFEMDDSQWKGVKSECSRVVSRPTGMAGLFHDEKGHWAGVGFGGHEWGFHAAFCADWRKRGARQQHSPIHAESCCAPKREKRASPFPTAPAGPVVS